MNFDSELAGISPPASPKSICAIPRVIPASFHTEILPGMKVAHLLKWPKRGSNDYSDYNDNGTPKPVQSLISCIIIDTSHTGVFRCVYTVNSVSSAWKLDPRVG